MARPSQAITFPEVFLRAYGSPRGFYPTATPLSADIMMGDDTHGWYKQAKDSALDGIAQTAKAKRVYERGMRPFERLGLRRCSTGIRPNDINTIGGQFVSRQVERPPLRGGIMFTKAGQDYVQKLLNARQKQYAEMGGDAMRREVPTSNTDETIGESALSAVYPLLDIVLDDLRNLNVKSLTNFNNWWSQMLTTLPILGSNFRERIQRDVIIPLESRLRSFASGTDPKAGNARAIIQRGTKALTVLEMYIGSQSQEGADDADWTFQADYNSLLQSGDLPIGANGKPMSYTTYVEQMERDRQRRGVPEETQYGNAPIDAPANVREKLVRELNAGQGVKITEAQETKAKKRIARLIAVATGETREMTPEEEAQSASGLPPQISTSVRPAGGVTATFSEARPYETYAEYARARDFADQGALADAVRSGEVAPYRPLTDYRLATFGAEDAPIYSSSSSFGNSSASASARPAFAQPPQYGDLVEQARADDESIDVDAYTREPYAFEGFGRRKRKGMGRK